MARREVIVMEDDLDGSTAEETITISMGSTTYQLDLSKKNADKFRKVVAPYVGAARTTPANARSRRRSRAHMGASPQTIRAWASANGLEVSSRGRIPAHVIEQFEADGN